jgi:hypothetical protein
LCRRERDLSQPPTPTHKVHCSLDSETSLKEVAYHLTRAIAACGADYDNESRYIELRADFDAEFADVRGNDPRPDYLDEDTSVAYPMGQILAIEIRRKGHNGLSTRLSDTLVVLA